MITVRNLQKSFGDQVLFDGAELQINNGDRFALVGPNGSGKSTLFKMLLGEMEADGGEIAMKKGAVVGYLQQENPPASEKKVLEEALSELENPEPSKIARAKAILMGLGFKEANFERQLSTLSGGWAMRAAMAKLLLSSPDLLLLDEPTNHLDLESILWFQDYLKNYKSAVFVISHDRAFINYFCRGIVAVKERELRVYTGNYEKYLEESRREKERLVSAWKRQQDEIRDMEDFIARNRARASTAGRAQSMIKRLEKMEKIELPEELARVRIRFPQPRRAGERVITLRKASKSYPLEEGGEVRVYSDLDFTLYRGVKAAFVGHNGAGKSTLLKMLAGAVKPDAGNRDVGVNVKAGYFSQHRYEQLDPEKTVLEEAVSAAPWMKEVDVRTILGTFLLRGNSVFKKTEVLSGGEKSRLSLVKVLLDPPNALFLDEPTTHLDMDSVDALVAALKDYEGTLCFISHDLYFINSLANHIVHVDSGRVSIYPGDYEYFSRRMEDIRREKNEAAEKVPEAAEGKDWEERREKKNAEKKNLKRIAQLREKVKASHAKIEKLAAEMSDPAIYSNYERVMEITREINALQDGIQAAEREEAELGEIQ